MKREKFLFQKSFVLLAMLIPRTETKSLGFIHFRLMVMNFLEYLHELNRKLFNFVYFLIDHHKMR